MTWSDFWVILVATVSTAVVLGWRHAVCCQNGGLYGLGQACSSSS